MYITKGTGIQHIIVIIIITIIKPSALPSFLWTPDLYRPLKLNGKQSVPTSVSGGHTASGQGRGCVAGRTLCDCGDKPIREAKLRPPSARVCWVEPLGM